MVAPSAMAAGITILTTLLCTLSLSLSLGKLMQIHKAPIINPDNNPSQASGGHKRAAEEAEGTLLGATQRVLVHLPTAVEVGCTRDA